MAERESQFVTVSRQGIIAVTAMGVGLLTFCFVIGVQVGKKSLTQKNIRVKTIDDEINELPEPLDVQLQIFESIESNPTSARNTPARQNTPAIEISRPPVADDTPSPTAANANVVQPNTVAPPQQNTVASPPQQNTVATPPRPNVASGVERQSNTGERYTVQVAALSDAGNAKRLSEQLKSQSYPARVVFSGGLYKVQLEWSGSRMEANSYVSRLQVRGHDAVAVRIQ